MLIATVVITLFCNWYFPYSFLAFKKEYTLNGDNHGIGQFSKDLESLQDKVLEKKINNELSQYIQKSIYYLEQPWLKTKGDVRLGIYELINMQKEVRELRDDLVYLDTRKLKVSRYDRDQLRLLIHIYETIDDSLETILDDRNMTRGELKTSLWNLRVEHVSSLDVLTTLYEEYLEMLQH
ncbi:hypothetical protein SAMN04488137_1774 [Fictibacillus solisalsi]|uniref:Uncharacterized protein n=1 Tax=Fictibacillus solisalsi TaxID=459525 RepID=A0A1G9VSY7_9BACL|nr:hypothetical protein [Fictibacillus solisalsi]SDM75263.1 hypothetical protein SAMN04488137_1774 [Fictibacillus solisalsi]